MEYAEDGGCRFGRFVWMVQKQVSTAAPGQELDIPGHAVQTSYDDRLRGESDAQFVDATLRLCHSCDASGMPYPSGFSSEGCVLSRLSPGVANKICEIACRAGVEKLAPEAWPPDWVNAAPSLPSVATRPSEQAPHERPTVPITAASGVLSLTARQQ
jgi:hypothetical protein